MLRGPADTGPSLISLLSWIHVDYAPAYDQYKGCQPEPGIRG